MRDHILYSQIECASITEDGLSDVSIMTIGEANGHGMRVDETTLNQFLKLSKGKNIPAYLTHEGAVGPDGKPKDRLGKEIGMFSGFYRDGERIRAKSFKFLDAFKATEAKAYQTLVELAKDFSDKLGISPVLSHFKAWVKKDGSEVRDDGKSVPAGTAFDLPAMRLGTLLSCDFVQKAATNVGLFEAIDDNPNKQKQMETIALSEHTTALQKKDQEIASLSQAHKDAVAALETKQKDTIAALEAKANEAIAQQAKLTTENAGLIGALAAKTKEAEDAMKYDMRKAGAPALAVALEGQLGAILPAPKATDAARWEQYATLCETVKDDYGNVMSHKETPAAKAFKDKHLTARK